MLFESILEHFYPSLLGTLPSVALASNLAKCGGQVGANSHPASVGRQAMRCVSRELYFGTFFTLATKIEVFRWGIDESHVVPATYKLFTKSAQSSGPENIGPKRPPFGAFGDEASALSSSRTTPEYNGKKSGRSRIGRTLSRGQVAEEVGFEPTVRFHARRFSRPVHSTTLPLLPRRFSGYSASRGLASARRSETCRLLAPKGLVSLSGAKRFRLASIGAQAPFGRGQHTAPDDGPGPFFTRVPRDTERAERQHAQERRVVFWDWRYRH